MAVELKTPKLYAEHQPETHRTLNPDHTVTEVELPGFVEVGVVLNGVRLPLHRLKAGKLLQRLAEHDGTAEPADE